MSWREPGEGFMLYTPEENADPNRHSFGFEKLVFERRAREWYRAAGETDEFRLMQLADRAYWRWHDTTINFREICRRRNVRMEANAENDWRSGIGSRDAGLTKPELEFLMDHFAGANDPTARSILEKAIIALSLGATRK